MVRVIALALLLIAATTSHADEPSNAQKAAIFAKSSVVRVLGFWEVTFTIGTNSAKEYVGGMGSGFFASADGFVVTNAHVVEDIKKGELEAKKSALRQLFGKLARTPDFARASDADKLQLAEQLLASATVVKNNDIVLGDGKKMKYDIVAYGKPGQGTDVSVIKVATKDAPNLQLADSEQVELQDKVLAIGYPGAADMQGLLDDKSQLEASINDGAISAMKRTPSGDPIIQITASITHGNSGGPTINDKGEVIGLSTFGSKGEVQGFNFIVVSHTVERFLKEAKANLAPSTTIKAWRKALDNMWALDLDAAIAGFDEVITQFPNHSEAPRQQRHARAMKKDGKGKKKEEPPAVDPKAGSSGGGGAGIAVAFIIVGALVLVVVLVVMKKKGAQPGGQPGHPGPHAGQHGHHAGQPAQHGQHPGQPGQQQPGQHGQHGQHAGQHGQPQQHGQPHAGQPHAGQPHAGQPQAHGQHAGQPGQHGQHAGQPGQPQQHGQHAGQPHAGQAGYAPNMATPGAGAPMMGGRVGPAPVAKTMAIGGQHHAPLAATAFGSMTMASLTCSRGLLNGQRFALTPQGLLIGRQPGLAQIVVNDSRASGKHVWIGYENGVLVAIDQGTTNGTFVNDVRLGRISKAPLKDGDTVI
ncbi:MAG: trypsin-like peptidase domain-containing protein, partial [Deltaproteobacteria bacterium]|nr:trypsin-like peptidase domain-containing protein [Deltaproteobacteria bacterium]